MDKSEQSVVGQGLTSPDPLVQEAYLMAFDYINYVTAKPGVPLTPAPSATSAALRHAGDELLQRFPIFFRRWPRVFQDVTEESACPTLVSILDEHFAPTRRRDLAWSAVLSIFVLAGQMALHCQQRGMTNVLPKLQDCVGSYVERVICPEIRDKGGWSGFVSRFGKKQTLEGQVKKVCCWSLLMLTVGILFYFLWKRRIT
ncbi:BCL2 like 16 [Pygocentrus nattereri]|uniref:Bcl-2 Bcl-2 homology region 1-3 domain-containing protein n=1 Tax=Pygocentrus nattereri TaxID=42514 RepID=A0A3B4CYY0_PYGNA|nr:BCL2 like 16 [Pygocentrus nattereri]XP_017551744.1 BCL2 like 16 [Pygocentrus nattereri]XP_017551745.1 BCL2 like 16 [Pygocentrus nattereri]XP_017551746.1 BCL2 like 16 [Pygocentrus nattereri]